MPNAVQYDLLTLVKTSIVNRGLNGISSSNVLIQKVATNKPSLLPGTPATFPCILLAPFGAEDLPGADGMTNRDDVVYHVLIAILAADNGKQYDHFNEYLYWRESIRKLFHDQPLPNQVQATVNGTVYLSGQLSWQVQVRMMDVVDETAWRRNLFASGMVLNARSREPRG